MAPNPTGRLLVVEALPQDNESRRTSLLHCSLTDGGSGRHQQAPVYSKTTVLGCYNALAQSVSRILHFADKHFFGKLRPVVCVNTKCRAADERTRAAHRSGYRSVDTVGSMRYTFGQLNDPGARGKLAADRRPPVPAKVSFRERTTVRDPPARWAHPVGQHLPSSRGSCAR